MNVFRLGEDSRYALGHLFILGLISYPDVLVWDTTKGSRITEKKR